MKKKKMNEAEGFSASLSTDISLLATWKSGFKSSNTHQVREGVSDDDSDSSFLTPLT